MAKKEEQLEKHITTSKQFNYSKKGVTLSFGLKVDNSSDLRAFLACLEAAEKDLKELIAGMSN